MNKYAKAYYERLDDTQKANFLKGEPVTLTEINAYGQKVTNTAKLTAKGDLAFLGIVRLSRDYFGQVYKDRVHFYDAGDIQLAQKVTEQVMAKMHKEKLTRLETSTAYFPYEQKVQGGEIKSDYKQTIGGHYIPFVVTLKEGREVGSVNVRDYDVELLEESYKVLSIVTE